jgi:glycosyltransferase involved in cell wall biosynthesis
LVKPFANFVLWHATSTQEKAEIKKLFPDANVKVVPNGTDLSAFDSAKFMSKLDYFYKFTGRNGYPNKVVVSMGRIQKKKGFDILIRSFQLLLKDFPGSVLLIAGGDEGEKEYLESIVSDLSIDNSVCFVGAISGQDKVDFLHNADLFVLPSHNENFGNVFLESLAAGTPIVASLDTPWAIVEQYGCGRWVKNDVISTYAAIKDMLVRDPKDLSTKSRLLARQYSWESVAERFNKIFIDMKSRLDIG